MEKLTRYRFEAVIQDTTEHRCEYLTNEFINILESNKPYQSKADYIGYSILSIDEKISFENFDWNLTHFFDKKWPTCRLKL